MADLADILQQLAYYKAGGKREGQRDIDKIAKTFGIISDFNNNYTKAKQSESEQLLRKMQAEKLANEISSIPVENRLKQMQAQKLQGEIDAGGKTLNVLFGTSDKSAENRSKFDQIKNNMFAGMDVNGQTVMTAPQPSPADVGGQPFSDATGLPEIYGNLTPDQFQKVASGYDRANAQNNRIDLQNIRDTSANARLNRRLDFQRKMQEIRNNVTNGKIPSDKAGMYTLANESILGIENAIKILFPDGTPNSFNRTTATFSNLPLIGAAPNNEDAQDLFRYIGNALAGRQLIQTGVAARPDETAQLQKRFFANFFTNPNSFYKALNELQDFYRNYNSTLISKRPINTTAGMGNQTSDINATAIQKQQPVKPTLMQDAAGNRAYVYPDGRIEEIGEGQ